MAFEITKVSDRDDSDQLMAAFLSEARDGIKTLLDYSALRDTVGRQKLEVEKAHEAITNRIWELCEALRETRDQLNAETGRADDLQERLTAAENANA